MTLGVFSVPGLVSTSVGFKNYVSYIFDSTNSTYANTYVIKSVDLDGSTTVTDELPAVEWVKIVIIESSNVTDDGAKSLNPKQAIYDELEKAGVDVNNYYQVMDYYNLEY